MEATIPDGEEPKLNESATAATDADERLVIGAYGKYLTQSQAGPSLQSQRQNPQKGSNHM